MKKILYIRGERDYFLTNSNKSPGRYKGLNPDPKNTDIFNFANGLSESWKKNIFNLWDKTFNVPYLSFRQKLRNLSLQNTKDIGYFDLILYNDTEYNNFLTEAPHEDFVIFAQDDDDFILPTIHDININTGLNIYIWPNVHFWKRQDTVKYSDHTPTDTKYHKIKSSHFCYRSNSKDIFDLRDLSNHRKISNYAKSSDDTCITYHGTYFNLYIWHPSSLCFLNTIATTWQFIGSTSPFSFEEQQDILKLNVDRIRRLMKIICKTEKDENMLNILKQVDSLYHELF